MIKTSYYSAIAVSLMLMMSACSNNSSSSSPSSTVNTSSKSSNPDKPNTSTSRADRFVPYRSSENAKSYSKLKNKVAPASYGHTKENPINVGGSIAGPRNQHKYLNALAGPQGQPIRYQRLGSCCAFKTKNTFLGTGQLGFLDVYRVSYKGLKKPVLLFLNLYETGELLAPKGFIARPD